MNTLSPELVTRLKTLAEKYETSSFCDGDPSRVLKRYTKQDDIETAAFISAILAFGRRDQFLAKLNIIFEQADKSSGPASWIRKRKYIETFLPSTTVKSGLCSKSATTADGSSNKTEYDAKFYRFYSYNDMIKLFDTLNRILSEYSTLGEYFELKYRNAAATESVQQPTCKPTIASNAAQQLVQTIPLATVICESFCDCCAVPHGKNTANKRINMFLRWMVRRASPVDAGLWDWYTPTNLVIPLDTHVLQVAKQFGLIPQNSTGTAKTATLLTDTLKQVWPDDPCKGDFALFGLGVDNDKERAFTSNATQQLACEPATVNER